MRADYIVLKDKIRKGYFAAIIILFFSSNCKILWDTGVGKANFAMQRHALPDDTAERDFAC